MRSGKGKVPSSPSCGFGGKISQASFAQKAQEIENGTAAAPTIPWECLRRQPITSFGAGWDEPALDEVDTNEEELPEDSCDDPDLEVDCFFLTGFCEDGAVSSRGLGDFMGKPVKHQKNHKVKQRPLQNTDTKGDNDHSGLGEEGNVGPEIETDESPCDSTVSSRRPSKELGTFETVPEERVESI
jgi:hypothetical protein